MEETVLAGMPQLGKIDRESGERVSINGEGIPNPRAHPRRVQKRRQIASANTSANF
jgi:hypothetical protein